MLLLPVLASFDFHLRSFISFRVWYFIHLQRYLRSKPLIELFPADPPLFPLIAPLFFSSSCRPRCFEFPV